MAKRVDQRLAADAVDLVADERVERPRLPFDDHPEAGRRAEAKLLLHVGERLPQIVRAGARAAESAHGVASLVDDLPHQRADARQAGARGRVLGQRLGGDVELHRRAEKSLQQRVVQLLRDARALGKALLEADVELLRHLVHTKPIRADHHQHK